MKTIEKLTRAFLGVLLALLLMPTGLAAAAGAGTWATKASMPAARTPNTVAGIGNLLYAVGGSNYVCGVYSTLEVYDPATDIWTAKISMPTGRWSLSSGVVNGILYAVGGTNGCYNPATGMTTVEAYDPSANTWTTKAPMPTARADHGVGVVNGILYVVGGGNGGVALNSVVAYDPTTNTWSTKAPMQTARGGGPGVGVVNGILYAVGGSSGVAFLNSVEAYNPATNTWTTVAPMSTARLAPSVSVVNGILYAVGGHSGVAYLNSVEAYNPATNTWGTVAPMPTARSGVSSGVVNNILYAVGGVATNNWPTAIVEAYTPNQTPIANAGPDQNIYLGQTALLNGLASSDPNGGALTYAWTLDSAPAGSAAALVSATTVTPSLTPDVAGAYHLSLVVRDSTGQNSAASTVAINVSLNLPPIAVATGNPVSGYAPLPVVFDAGASRDPESGVLSFSWNFGDPASGANNTSALKNPIHTYAGVGNYSAVVTVTDNLGKTDQASVAITVTAPNLPPVVSPTATPNNGAAPLNVQFAANATDVNSGDVLSYSWNFGDGSPLSTLANPQHSYAAGTYTAVVRVSDGANAPVSANLTISVSSALTIDVTEAKVERGEKGKVEGKISMQADFNFAGMPASGDIISVKFDGITLLNVPFGSFRQESAGKYEYATKTQEAEIDFNRKTIKVSSHKILTGDVNNANGIDVVISFGAATGTDNFVMTSQKGEKDNRDSDLSHKKDSKRK